MKVIVNNYIPIGNRFGAINIFGILFVKRGTYITPELLNHELIHTHQIRELFFIPFYIIYVLELYMYWNGCSGCSDTILISCRHITPSLLNAKPMRTATI